MGSSFQILSSRERANNDAVLSSGLMLRRACACGEHTSGSGCGACSSTRTQSEQATGSGARQMESAASDRSMIGQDFSNVHAYAYSSASFNQGVLKNRSSDFGGDSPIRTGSTLPYHEAKELTECMRIMGPENAAFCRQEVLGEKPRPCSEANKAERLRACIQPVLIADDDGKNPTTAPSLNQITSIWSKCCINYNINSAKTVKKTAYKTLEESPSNTPSAEESSLFQDAGASSCIQVFIASTFSQGGTTSKDISGGAGTYGRGTANPKIVAVEGAAPEVIAHEVGHAAGFAGHDGAGETVMKPTGAHDQANSHAVSTEVCTRARTGSVLTKAGAAKDCCINPA